MELGRIRIQQRLLCLLLGRLGCFCKSREFCIKLKEKKRYLCQCAVIKSSYGLTSESGLGPIGVLGSRRALVVEA